MLMLDAAYPPPPPQLVADCRAIGAGAVAAYVYGGITRYTPAHYDALNRAGIRILPIVVPGNVPPNGLAQLLSSSGFQGGPLAIDLEFLSLPPDAWVRGLRAALPGFTIGLYGQRSTLRNYTGLDFAWLAEWPYAPGVWQPAPQDLGGWAAWQFAHDVALNGSQYDVSLIADSIFGGDDLAQVSQASWDALNEKVDKLVASDGDLWRGADAGQNEWPALTRLEAHFADLWRGADTAGNVWPAAVSTRRAIQEAIAAAIKGIPAGAGLPDQVVKDLATIAELARRLGIP